MCGITGALDLTGIREFPRSRLYKMMNAIAHRGPDAEHAFSIPGIVLGVRRLAIIDLENGHQPVKNEKENIISTVNGELFDYKEIRRHLIKRGHQLKTECDAELWVHLYEDYGEALFNHVSGQFAVSIWDQTNRILLLGRDKVGICPLYYTIRDGWLLWGSEIKALLASEMFDPEPDLKGIDYLFNFYGPATNRTFFKDIKLLPPGHFLRIKDGKVDLKKYWDLEFPDKDECRSEKDPHILVDELDGLLSQAVRKRLNSDVPVVSYLSGGLDSSLILSMSSRLSGQPLPSFSIGMHKKSGPDEQSHANEVAALVGSKLTTVPMDSTKLARLFPEFIIATEGPVLDTSCAALMHLATEIHNQGFKVALTGEGADEAFAGYIWFKSQKILNSLGSTLPKLLRKTMRYSIKGHRKNFSESTHPLKSINPAQQYMYDALSLSRDILYSEDMWSNLQGHDAYSDLILPNERVQHWHPLNQSIYVNYKVMLAGLLLISKGDRIAMHSSVETRFPFLDDEVIQFCASLAPHYKLRKLTDKWLLRQLAAKTLPRHVAHRPKSMFRSKLSPIFLGKHRPYWVDQLLSPASLLRTGYFDPHVIEYERKRQISFPCITPRRLILDAMLTCVVTTQLWHHLFFGGGLCDLPVYQANPKRPFNV